MLRITRTFASSLALLVVTGAIAPPAVHAWSTNAAYREVADKAEKKGAPVTFQIYNKDEAVQQVKVAGQVYKLDPHSGTKITAPEGAQVIAATDGKGHHSGDMLFQVSAALKGNTVSID
jgi:murein DD-endopeptidase MepM/ murein hydrolase activator NlpD